MRGSFVFLMLTLSLPVVGQLRIGGHLSALSLPTNTPASLAPDGETLLSFGGLIESRLWGNVGVGLQLDNGYDLTKTAAGTTLRWEVRECALYSAYYVPLTDARQPPTLQLALGAALADIRKTVGGTAVDFGVLDATDHHAKLGAYAGIGVFVPISDRRYGLSLRASRSFIRDRRGFAVSPFRLTAGAAILFGR